MTATFYSIYRLNSHLWSTFQANYCNVRARYECKTQRCINKYRLWAVSEFLVNNMIIILIGDMICCWLNLHFDMRGLHDSLALLTFTENNSIECYWRRSFIDVFHLDLCPVRLKCLIFIWCVLNVFIYSRNLHTVWKLHYSAHGGHLLASQMRRN